MLTFYSDFYSLLYLFWLQEDLIQELIRDKNSQGSGSGDPDVDEFTTPPSTPKSNGSAAESPKNLSLTDSNNSRNGGHNKNGESEAGSSGHHHHSSDPGGIEIAEVMKLLKTAEEEAAAESAEREAKILGAPQAPPRRKHGKNLLQHKVNTSPPRTGCNGLPPTPKVHMGACFSKVFNECPLRILCSASWVHPETRDQHILLGCEEVSFKKHHVTYY